MILLALDPGTRQTGFTFFNTETSAPQEHGDIGNEQILPLIPACDELVIEGMISWATRVGETTRQTLIWIGRFIQAAVFAGIPWHILARDKVKTTLGLKAKCRDAEIDHFIQELYVPNYNRYRNPGILKGFAGDSWAALALATAYCVRNNLLK